MRFLARTAAAFSILAIASLFVPGGAQAAKPDEKLKVGITKNFFQNFSETIARLVMQPFPEVVKAQTGLPGEIAMSPDSTELCERMKKGDAHLGVFQGHEFFWASRKYPELKPLMLAVNEKTPLKAYLIARKSDSNKPISEMAGKTLAIPTQTRPFARLWVERRAVLPGKALHEHYAKVFPIGDSEEALDNVREGSLDLVLVEKASWDRYKRIKPSANETLSPILESETFPSTVIAYFPKSVQNSYVERFRKGMMTADQNPGSARLLQLVKISSFQPVPNDFMKEGESLIQAYPPANPR
ncbi:MAG: PhnD/SsuA/transferrin family substrate-binding protein [Planctomycetes bacterium]|nr:PhnD/SsuA/transferrin family substrate-binding protein [Planctomycetota bacterium]